MTHDSTILPPVWDDDLQHGCTGSWDIQSSATSILYLDIIKPILPLPHSPAIWLIQKCVCALNIPQKTDTEKWLFTHDALIVQKKKESLLTLSFLFYFLLLNKLIPILFFSSTPFFLNANESLELFIWMDELRSAKEHTKTIIQVCTEKSHRAVSAERTRPGELWHCFDERQSRATWFRFEPPGKDHGCMWGLLDEIIKTECDSSSINCWTIPLLCWRREV